MTGGAVGRVGGLRHGTAQFEGVAAGAAAVLVARHAPRLVGATGNHLSMTSIDHSLSDSYMEKLKRSLMTFGQREEP
jgi:hypothetical protein